VRRQHPRGRNTTRRGIYSGARRRYCFQMMEPALIVGVAAAGVMPVFLACVSVAEGFKSRHTRRECARVMRERYGWHRRL
jgi:hypothetical protein